MKIRMNSSKIDNGIYFRKEAKLDKEKPLMASVFYNRIKRK